MTKLTEQKDQTQGKSSKTSIEQPKNVRSKRAIKFYS